MEKSTSSRIRKDLFNICMTYSKRILYFIVVKMAMEGRSIYSQNSKF